MCGFFLMAENSDWVLQWWFTTDLHWKFLSTPKDSSDIDKLPKGSGSVPCAPLEISMNI